MHCNLIIIDVGQCLSVQCALALGVTYFPENTVKLF